jgi:GntR family transcriptional regulator
MTMGLSHINIDDYLDPNSYTPLYIQLYEVLRSRIEKGVYIPGDKLPSEREIIEQYNVSRMTVTSALQKLVRSGFVYRIRGKGTFVAKPKIRGLSSFGSFTTDIQQRGMVPGSRVLSFEVISPDTEVRERLGLDEGENCYKLVRVRLADDEPVAVESAYLPEKLFPNLDEVDLASGSLYNAMEQHYGLFPTWSEGIFEADTADEEQAKLLDLELCDPILWVHRITLDNNFVPLEWVSSMYRADRFSFSTGRQPVNN